MVGDGRSGEERSLGVSFKTGDLVHLRGFEQPTMMVHTADEDGIVECFWFDRNLCVQVARFSVEVLEPALVPTSIPHRPV